MRMSYANGITKHPRRCYRPRNA